MSHSGRCGLGDAKDQVTDGRYSGERPKDRQEQHADGDDHHAVNQHQADSDRQRNASWLGSGSDGVPDSVEREGEQKERANDAGCRTGGSYDRLSGRDSPYDVRRLARPPYDVR